MDKFTNSFKYLSDVKLFQIVSYLDNHITRNLRDGGIATRPASSNGLWCCGLLPGILSFYSIFYDVSNIYKVMACVSAGLFTYSILFIIFMSVSCLVLKDNIYGGCLSASLISALFIYAVLGQGLFLSLVLSILSVYMYNFLLKYTLISFPKTFTIGEAMIVTQSMVMFTFMVILRLFTDLGDYSDEEMNFVYAVDLSIISTVGIIVTAICILEEHQRIIQSLYYILLVAVIYVIIILHSFIGSDCLIRLFSYVFLDVQNLILFCLWAFLFLVAVCVVMFRTQLAVKATTVTRKTFHILASAVFLCGYLADIHLMTLAAGFGLAVIILGETLRKSKIEPISSFFEAAFQIYSDEKDMGGFALTAIYLFVGLACPLLLVPVYEGCELEMLSGALSIGVGDTAASWFGSKYGFHKWKGAQKTWEGTLFNILSQVTVVYALVLFGLLDVQRAFFRAFVAALISGLVEARTDQVDNLILPLVTILAFQLTSLF